MVAVALENIIWEINPLNDVASFDKMREEHRHSPPVFNSIAANEGYIKAICVSAYYVGGKQALRGAAAGYLAGAATGSTENALIGAVAIAVADIFQYILRTSFR